MSNYTGKRRSGGGVTVTTQLNRILDASVIAVDTISAGYVSAIAVGTLLANDFNTAPTGIHATSLAQGDPDQILLTFPSDISGEGDLFYNGTLPQVQHPQLVPLT